MITVKQRGEGSGQMIIALHFHKGGLAILHHNEIWGMSHSTPKSDYVLMDHPLSKGQPLPWLYLF